MFSSILSQSFSLEYKKHGKFRVFCTYILFLDYSPQRSPFPVLPRASKIICDSKEAALSETGDLLIPIADGIITEEDVLGSLGDVINGKIKGRENDEEIIVYETVGVAAQDLVAAKVIYDKAVEAGKGLRWGE